MVRSPSVSPPAIVCRETRRPLCPPRAVGAAVARNPISIIVPCHRVVAADDSLNGYAGGLDRKEWLLRLEGAYEE